MTGTCEYCGRVFEGSLDACPVCEHNLMYDEVDEITRLQNELAEAERQRDEYKADAERLSFLEAHEPRFIKLGKTWYHRSWYGQPHHKARSLRQAIDALLAAQGEPK